MNNLENLNIKIFADGADFENFEKLNNNNVIQGFTTNPTLMKKAGIKSYKNFALEILKIVKTKRISFEVFADSIIEMERQANEIASWGDNVNVKIPITNTKGELTNELISRLSKNGVKCNVTAIFTNNQIKKILEIDNYDNQIILSIFAGRIADSGVDPINIMSEAVELVSKLRNFEILWASPRELLNIFQANEIGCDIITIPNDILKKIDNIGKDLEIFSLETVKMFYNDAKKAGYKIE
tara:strand:+ start:780 stop:1499 length:720 start_codon:yes stop_codon:yes gene_type:complete